MNKLSNNIYAQYLQQAGDLPVDKRLHLAARLVAWSGDSSGQRILDGLRPLFAKRDASELLSGIYDGSVFEIKQGSVNALTLRQPYFERYPTLRHSAALLYWTHVLETSLDIRVSQHLGAIVSFDDLDRLHHALSNDDQAVAMLSTHAVNFLYLYPALTGRMTPPPAQHFFDISLNQYDLGDPLQLQLCIYLLTHVIIGESRFYAQRIPAESLAVCRAIMQRLETLLSAQYDHVKLDNKFEFLVCCRLTGHDTSLEGRIMQEAEQSVSPNGTYLIDTHNQNPQADYASFEKSEHRNVLFIMATTASQLAPAYNDAK